MAIGVRDITNLEELLEVQDDDKIVVIQNGEAKMVSKANAKFGGGTVTIFYQDVKEIGPNIHALVDANGDPVSAQAAYDAVMSGPVYFKYTEGGAVVDIFLVPYTFLAMKKGAAIVSIIFMAKDRNGELRQFGAEDNPSGGVG